MAHFYACPLYRQPHPLCTAPPRRETQTDDLTLHTLRALIAQNVWARDAGDSRDVEWLDVLSDEDPATPPARPPWRALTWALPAEEAGPTIYVPGYEHYYDVPRSSLPPVRNLPDSWGPVSTMNLNNWRTTVITLTTRLPFTFGWLVGDAEWAMVVVRGAHGNEWGDFFHCSAALNEGADREADGGLSHPDGDTPPPQRCAIGAGRPTAGRPTAAAGQVGQCGGGLDDGGDAWQHSSSTSTR